MTVAIKALLQTAHSYQACSAWFIQYAPIRDDAIVAHLRAEANRRDLSAPASELEISEILSIAAEVWNDQETKAIAWLVEANAYRKLGEPTRALPLYQSAIEIYKNAGQFLNAARAAVGQIDTLLYLGDYEQALTIADWSAELLRDAGDIATLGKVLSNRGNILARLGEYARAHECYENARTLFEQEGDANSQAIVAVNDANALTELNDFYTAEGKLSSAYTYFEQAGLTGTAAQILHNLAYLSFCLGDYQLALSRFAKARDIFIDQNSEIDIAYVDLYRTELYLALNLWQEVIELTTTTIPIFTNANLQWECARLWMNESIAHHRNGDSASAHNTMANAVAFFTNEDNEYWLAVCHLYLATFEKQQGSLDVAQEKAGQALRIFTANGIHNQAAKCDVLLGEIALQKMEMVRAEEHFLRALERIGDVKLPAVRYLCHFGLGQIKQWQARFDDAYHHLHLAISDIELLQLGIGAEDNKIAFRSDKIHVYETFVLLCLNMGTTARTIEALTTIEQAKSRALVETMKEAKGWRTANSGDERQDALMNDLRRQLHWRYSRFYTAQPDALTLSSALVEQLTGEISQLEYKLTQHLKALRLQDTIATPLERQDVVTLQQIQALLPEKSLFLEYFVVQDEIVIIGVGPNDIWTVRLAVSYRRLNQWVEQLQMQMGKFRFGADYVERYSNLLLYSVQDCLRALYDLLVKPLVDRLDGDLLFIAPHDVLHYIPFHAFFDGQRHLLEEKSVILTPSATLLHHVLSLNPQKMYDPPIIVGTADESVPFALAEADALGSLFPSATMCLDANTSLEKLLKSSANPAFIHIAAHAVFRSDNPLFSAIKLTNEWMNVNDIGLYNFSAPLVTLSACETGHNHIAAGDELIGLCRGFFRAGANSMIVSLWQVDDRVTKELMLRFYDLWRQGMMLHDALRIAQNEIRRQWHHPYYWASFVLIGNPFLKIDSLLAEQTSV